MYVRLTCEGVKGEGGRVGGREGGRGRGGVKGGGGRQEGERRGSIISFISSSFIMH